MDEEVKQTIFAQPWSDKTFKPEEQGKPKGNIKHAIKVCRGINCSKKESEPLYKDLSQRFATRNDVDVSYCYCLGHCMRGSNVVINGNVINFVTVNGLDFLLKKHIYRLDELEKAGLTPEDLDTILFQPGM